MELYLQQGWGMMDHSQELINIWGGGKLIMSPRDLTPAQLNQFPDKLSKVNGDVFLDPQFYLPNSEHVRLTSHEYWPKTYGTEMFWGSNQVEEMISTLIKKNETLKANEIILPGLFGEAIDDHWLGIQSKIDQIGAKLKPEHKKIIATVSLGSDALKNNDMVHNLLDHIRRWKSEAIYLMCEPPKGEYLTDDASWLCNLLDLSSGIRLAGKNLIVGYSSHLSLLLCCAPVNAIASGTFLNVRSFTSSKFEQTPESGGGNRSIWYYCPQAMSEYKLTYLDIAQKLEVLDKLKTSEDDKYSRLLFEAPQPSLSNFGESDAHRHYLNCLYRQSKLLSAKETFEKTCDSYLAYLDQTEKLLEDLTSQGISGEKRDFSKSIQPCRSAIAVLKKTRGPVLKRNWGKLNT